MKFTALLALPASLAAAFYTAAESPDYSEHLHLKPLSGSSLYAGFQFSASASAPSYEAQHFRYFPRSLAQILQYTHTPELHLRFSLGRWDEESWGSRPRSGAREGGNGVELWAWVEEDEAGEVESRWSDLVNSLSGLFCASLNFIDSGKTTRPVLSFDPDGTLEEWQAQQRNQTGEAGGRLQLLHGMLPHEVVCTENLTPFLKLLPCKGKAGIGSLLDGHKVFDSDWQTMSIDVAPRCTADGCSLDIQQTSDMVLDISRSMRRRDDPIPRPLPIGDIPCDESKSYHAADTCFPRPHEGEMAWSIEQIFGHPIPGRCPLSADAWSDVSLEVPAERTVEVTPNSAVHALSHVEGNADTIIHTYRLAEDRGFDISLPQQTINASSTALDQPPLYASRQITGYGAERGGMHATLTNPQPFAQRVVYLESLPWFLRPYMHTLRVEGGRAAQMYYTPLLDRRRGTQLELLIELPPHSTAALTYDFEKAVLRYTEYPPDANRGFDVAPAIIRVLGQPGDGSVVEGRGDSSDGQDYYLRTTSLLLPLPTPDFSMPYNVIILTSTVIALGFGSLFNLLVRRFVLAEEVPPSASATLMKAIVEKIRRVRGQPPQAQKQNGVVGPIRGSDQNGQLPASEQPLKEGTKKER